jgi:hypothetical protein
MACDLCRQTRPQPAESMGALAVEAQGMQARGIASLAALPDAGQPAPQRLWPRGLPLSLGRTQDLRPIGLPPRRRVRWPRNALRDAGGAQRWRPDGRSAWVRPAPQGKAGVGTAVGFDAGRATTTAGHHPHRGDRPQELAPVLPARPVAPADSGQPRQPPGSSQFHDLAAVVF